ncbi:MAG: S8 family serine peptidase [Armatimonadetes bacterium]|nr:S8 family serine peptidase [Armatimonadota bacterium]
MNLKKFCASLILAAAVSASAHAGISTGLFAPPPAPSYKPGRVLVRLQAGADASRLLAQTGLSRIERIPQIQVEVLAVPAGQEREWTSRLEARPEVAYAIVDTLFRPLGTSNDLFFATHQWYLSKMRVPEAWDITTGSEEITIAVLDSGIDLEHPDLKDKLVPGYNPVNEAEPPTDADGHGTHVAGLAAAMSNNEIGIAGVSWGAKIMPIKVSGADGSMADSDIAKGMVWGADRGAKIFNLSLGGEEADTTTVTTDAIKYVRDRNGLILAAAGNEAEEGNPISYPAAYPGVMAVGALAQNDTRSPFSQIQDYVSVAAPGGVTSDDEVPDNPLAWIYSTYPLAKGGFKGVQGTSMATPLVSGVAALVWSAHPNYTADQVREAIEKTAVDLGPEGKDKEFGFGRVDSLAAINYRFDTALPGDVNLDKQVDVSDAVLTLQVAVQIKELTPEQAQAADVVKDGSVNVNDAIKILRVVAKLDAGF